MAFGPVSAVQLLLLLIALLTRLSTCIPITSDSRHTFRNLPITHKRQGGFFSVLGIAGLQDNSLHPRLEIRELERNRDQWNVYILGLQRFQSIDPVDKLSYYQVAGIHGRPYVAWDGVGLGPPGSGNGYCTHSSNIFPTWHRPYLALFEELLYLNARQVVSEFPNGALKDRYNEALRTFRMPYWDWAAIPPSGGPLLPTSVQRPTIDVVLANGTNTIPNPLFSYRFPASRGADRVFPPWTLWTSTLRDPSSSDANAASRNDLVSAELDRTRANFQSRIYNVLAIEKDYLQISNSQQVGDSIESLHDTIHNILGDGGHMSNIGYSAFDPIFWLHHTNVDRIFAIWQALNPNSYVTPLGNPFASFTTPAGFVSDVNTPLTPFHRSDAGDFWTSETVRSTNAFAYTYPELLGIGNDTSPLINRVNALYGPQATPQKRSIPPFLVGRNHLTPRGIAGAPNFSEQRKYTTNIKVQKFGPDGSLNIYVFLGEDPGFNPKVWVSAASFVGVTGILSQSARADSPKPETEAHGEVPLTAALEAKVRSGNLESMKEDVVAEYLKANLKWRVSKMDGEHVPNEDVLGLQLSVLWWEIEPALSANEFPKVVGDFRVLADVTDGRPGGLGKGETV